MVSVKGILDMSEFQDHIIHVGQAGMARSIRWVHVIDHDDVGRYLEGGELLLSCGQVWPETPQAEEQLLDAFLEHHIAGMVFATGAYIDDIPPSVLAFGEKYDIPILEVPFHISFVKITQKILQRILNAENKAIDSKEKVLASILEKVKSARNTSQICRMLSANLGCYATITNIKGEILTDALIAEIGYREIKNRVGNVIPQTAPERGVDAFFAEERFVANQAIFLSKVPAPYALCVPLQMTVNEQLVLWLFHDQRPFDSDDGLVAEYASVILTYFILNEQDIKASRRRSRLELLQLLLDHRCPDTLAVQEKAQELGMAVETNCLAGVLISGRPYTNEEMLVWKTSCQQWLDAAEAISGFCEIYQGQLLLIACFQGAIAEQMDLWFQPLYEQLRHIHAEQIPVLVMGGCRQQLFALYESYQEARQLAPIVQYRHASGGCYFADNLRRELFVYGAFDAAQAQQFRQLVLPEALFSEKGAPLYETLKSLAYHGYNRDKVAAELHIHRNTLRYRIRRIEHLLQDQLSSHRCQFWVQMALDLESVAKQTNPS